jgi:hypothetical protein
MAVADGDGVGVCGGSGGSLRRGRMTFAGAAALPVTLDVGIYRHRISGDSYHPRRPIRTPTACSTLQLVSVAVRPALSPCVDANL